MSERYLAQCLINEGRLSREELLQLLGKKSFEAVTEAAGPMEAGENSPVVLAVRKAAGKDDLLFEKDAYGSYMELFMESLIEFLEAPAVVDPTPMDSSELTGENYAVSQSMKGDMSIVSGIVAVGDIFQELAERYSGESVDSAEDELAIDSLQEFLNVVNGLFCVESSSGSKDVDLGIPRWGKVTKPQGNNQLLLRIFTDFGHFYVVLSADEFI